jgi:hypothetical protein
VTGGSLDPVPRRLCLELQAEPLSCSCARNQCVRRRVSRCPLKLSKLCPSFTIHRSPDGQPSIFLLDRRKFFSGTTALLALE